MEAMAAEVKGRLEAAVHLYDEAVMLASSSSQPVEPVFLYHQASVRIRQRRDVLTAFEAMEVMCSQAGRQQEEEDEELRHLLTRLAGEIAHACCSMAGEAGGGQGKAVGDVLTCLRVMAACGGSVVAGGEEESCVLAEALALMQAKQYTQALPLLRRLLLLPAYQGEEGQGLARCVRLLTEQLEARIALLATKRPDRRRRGSSSTSGGKRGGTEEAAS